MRGITVNTVNSIILLSIALVFNINGADKEFIFTVEMKLHWDNKEC
jgi:hypothetical protein